MSAIDKLQGWINKLEQFDLWDACCSFYKENEKKLIALTQTQLTQTMDMYGYPIYGWKYPADLYYEGGFYRGMTINTDNEKIEFTSTDRKWEHFVPPAPGFNRSMTPIIDYWGMDVLGVPEQEQGLVDEATADYVGDALHTCFE